MHTAKTTSIALALATATSLGHSADNWSARNQAMGGAGVASSNYDAASTVNPALLTEFGDSDDIALVIPSLGVEVSDKNGVIDSLDTVSDQFDTLDTQINAGQIPAATITKDAIISELSGISGKPVYANLGGRIAVAIPGKTFAFAIDLRTDVEGGAIGVYDPDDEELINQAIITGDSALLDDIGSSGLVMAASVSELALAMATEFTPGKQRLSIGVTPKYQRVDTILYLQRANNFDSGDIDTDDFRNDDGNFNMDIGAAWWITEKLNLGLAVQNLISADYDTVVVEGFQTTYQIKPLATAGVAWNGPLFTYTFDADLNTRNTFKELDDSQFLRAGFEFNAADWAALRAGYRHDLKDTRENVFTLGVGFSPFTVFHFDLTGSIGNNDTYGAALELKFML